MVSDFISTRELATRAGISPQRVRQCIAENRLPGAQRCGRDYVIPVATAVAFCQRHNLSTDGLRPQPPRVLLVSVPKEAATVFACEGWLASVCPYIWLVGYYLAAQYKAVVIDTAGAQEYAREITGWMGQAFPSTAVALLTYSGQDWRGVSAPRWEMPTDMRRVAREMGKDAVGTTR